jgi:hypothetical protein
MRFALLCICALALLGCGGPPIHPWWRPMTPEEQEHERQYEQSRDDRIAARRQAKQDDLHRRDEIIQAHTLRDVDGCERLGLIRGLSLDNARMEAVRLDGDHILSERNRWRDPWTGETRNDFTVYRCEPREPDVAKPPSPAASKPPQAATP